MLKEKIYKVLVKGINHPTNEEYSSNKFIMSFSLMVALIITGTTLGVASQYSIKTLIYLSLSMGFGTFVILYCGLRFGKMLSQKIKSEKRKKLIVVLLYVLIVMVFLLPFVMHDILG